jgi:hypothetical protein
MFPLLPRTNFDPYQTSRILIPGLYATTICVTLFYFYMPSQPTPPQPTDQLHSDIQLLTLFLLVFMLPILFGLFFYALDLPKRTPFARKDNPSVHLVNRCLRCNHPCFRQLRFLVRRPNLWKLLMMNPFTLLSRARLYLLGQPRESSGLIDDPEADSNATNVYFYMFYRFITGDMKTKIEYFNSLFVTCENIRFISLFGCVASFTLQCVAQRCGVYCIPTVSLFALWICFLCVKKHRTYRISTERMQCEWLDLHSNLVERVVCLRTDPESINASSDLLQPRRPAE